MCRTRAEQVSSLKQKEARPLATCFARLRQDKDTVSTGYREGVEGRLPSFQPSAYLRYEAKAADVRYSVTTYCTAQVCVR